MLNDTSPEYASLVASKVNVVDVTLVVLITALADTSVLLPILREFRVNAVFSFEIIVIVIMRFVASKVVMFRLGPNTSGAMTGATLTVPLHGHFDLWWPYCLQYQYLLC